MNIQAIRLFLHVTQRGSLVAGARALNMSPSAASRLLSGLERTTGLKLFSRDGHALRPTAEGAQYFNECHRVLLAVDELPHAARRLAGGARSRLKVGSGSWLATSLMLPAIGRFAKNHPDVEVDFQLTQMHEFTRLASEHFDVAAGALLPATIKTVTGSALFDMPTIAVMRADHVLAKRSFVRAADVIAHPMVGTSIGPTKENLEYLFHSEGAEYHPQYTVNSFEHGCQLLLQIGAIMITDPLAPLAIGPHFFALVPFKPLRMVQTSIYTPTLRPESRLVAEFVACVREEAKSLEKRVAALLGNSFAKAAASGRSRGSTTRRK